MALDTTAKGSCGSRGSSRAGSNVDSGATGFSGESKTGRLLGAQAAVCGYGAATFRGGASGFWKAEGRSIGAYSGPSSHVATQLIVDAAVGRGALCKYRHRIWIDRLCIGVLTARFGVGPAERSGYA
jgi:hypothetical protein